MEYKARPHQKYGTKRIIETEATGPFVDMGLGKTIMALTAWIELKKRKLIKNTLIIAPKQVANNVWPDEIHKWNHTRHIVYSKVLGSAKQRRLALRKKADIYIINVDNIAWLVQLFGNSWPFDFVIIDESSTFKNPESQRFKTLRMVRRYINRIVELTGTPAPNGYLDLWSQLYLLDKGERLYDSFSKYRNTYFEPDKRNGHTTYSYRLRKGDYLLGDEWYEKEILDRVKDICFSMRTEDYVQLPPIIDNVRKIQFSDELMARYEDFEKESVIEWWSDMYDEQKDNIVITAVNAAVLTGKLLQFTNGALYDEDKNWHTVHDEKLDALEELYEELNGNNNMLVFYSFISDRERIAKRFKDIAVDIKTPGAIKKWNERKIPILYGHPASAGHGLNLQYGGEYITWFGTPWSLEQYLQGRKRIYRPNVRGTVFNTQLAVEGTVDVRVLKTLDRKNKDQNTIIDAVKALIEKYV